jgi:type II secretory pathway pseudopilin PulG
MESANRSCEESAGSRAGAGRRRAAVSGEGGFTLIELLTSISLLILVFAAIMVLIPTAFRIAQPGPERTFTVEAARIAVDKVMRELRTATWISTPSQQVLRFDTPTKSITVECTQGGGQGGSGQGQGSNVCVRREAALGGNPSNNPGTALAEGVENTDVFGIAQGGPPNARDYVCIRVVMTVAGRTAPVTIQDAVALRNNQVPTVATPGCESA